MDRTQEIKEAHPWLSYDEALKVLLYHHQGSMWVHNLERIELQRCALPLCTANYSEENFGFITNTTFKGSGTNPGPVVFLNGPPDSVTINSNTVTFGTHAEKLACGFRLTTNSSDYNSTGTNTVVATAAGPVWKYANAQFRT